MTTRVARKPGDKAPWLLAASVALTLSGVAGLAPHGSAQAKPRVVLADITTHAAPAADDDGDGDELMEHWGDPKYSHEEWTQLAGMAVFFAAIGALSVRRRAALGRSSRHG